MLQTMLGVKKGMTSSYDARGRRVGATVVELGPNIVTQIKSMEKDGYMAVQLGFGFKKSIKKPQQKLLEKISAPNLAVRFFRETKVDDVGGLEAGKQVSVGEIFKTGDAVKVTGVSKGKGFQGGVRRHGFHGGPKTHGQSDRHRAPGSIGAGTTPGRVYKGKRMAGHMGAETVSVTGLEVLGVDRDNNLISIKGGIPGSIGGLVVVQRQGVIKGYTPPPEEKEEEEEESSEHSENSEKSENQNVSGSEKSDTSETQSPAESSENKKGDQENAS